LADALDVGDWFELMDGRLHVPDDVLAEFGDLSLGGADLVSALKSIFKKSSPSFVASIDLTPC